MQQEKSKDSKIKRIINAISGEVNVTVPTSWSTLNDKELRYIFLLKVQGREDGEIKRLFFLRKAGMNPVREVKPGVWLAQCGRAQCYVNVRDIAFGEEKLAWMSESPSYPVRLSTLRKCDAVQATLHGVSFGKWLSLENLHQGFILSKNPDAVRDMAEILYPGINRKELNDLDLFNVNFWYVGIKIFFARKWSALFSGDGGSGGTYNPEASMNAMIRSLTGGDVLKEQPLLEGVEVWRALTELNEKAKEAAKYKEAKS